MKVELKGCKGDSHVIMEFFLSNEKLKPKLLASRSYIFPRFVSTLCIWFEFRLAQQLKVYYLFLHDKCFFLP